MTALLITGLVTGSAAVYLFVAGLFWNTKDLLEPPQVLGGMAVIWPVYLLAVVLVVAARWPIRAGQSTLDTGRAMQGRLAARRKAARLPAAKVVSE
jgi:hypothetical protein